MQYPRIDSFKRKNYVPIYREYFEVQTRRPNRQLKFKVFQTKTTPPYIFITEKNVTKTMPVDTLFCKE